MLYNILHKIYLKITPSVTRIKVLKYVKKHKDAGLCNSIKFAYFALCHTIWCRIDICKLFPLFSYDNALNFGARRLPPAAIPSNCYWWEEFTWDTGREDFLDWLIEQYKDDKTDLRTLL